MLTFSPNLTLPDFHISEKKEAQLFFLLPKLVLWPENIGPWLAVGPAGSQHSLVHRVLTLQCIASSFPPQSEAAADRTRDINRQSSCCIDSRHI